MISLSPSPSLLLVKFHQLSAAFLMNSAKTQSETWCQQLCVHFLSSLVIFVSLSSVSVLLVLRQAKGSWTFKLVNDKYNKTTSCAPHTSGICIPKKRKKKGKNMRNKTKVMPTILECLFVMTFVSVCLSVSLSLFLLLRTLTYQFRLRLSSSCCSQLTPEMEASVPLGWAWGSWHFLGRNINQASSCGGQLVIRAGLMAFQAIEIHTHTHRRQL